MSVSRGAVAYGKESINFGLSYANRKTLEIAVNPDRTVDVKAPLGTDVEEVQKRVVRRAGWIIRQRDFFRLFDPRTPPRCYVGGETHLYLGKRYRLRIYGGTRDVVKLTGGFIEIQVNGDGSPEKIRSLVENWYRRRAALRFRESIDRCWPHFSELASERPVIRIRKMKKRWGSISMKGRLTLNADLIRAPRECIDYVIIHELTHLFYKNHGPKFYKFMAGMMPDWNKRKHKLEVTLA